MGKKNSKKEKDGYSKSVIKLLQFTNDMIKSKPNDRGEFDLKDSQPHHKKTRRQIECMCMHWRLDKDDVPQPATESVPGRPDIVKCRICRAEFPWLIKTIDPSFPEQTPYKKEIDDFLGAVNTVVWYATKYSSGKTEDFGVFTALRKGIKEFRKISYAVSYTFTKQRQFADRASQAESDFNAYSGTGLRFS